VGTIAKMIAEMMEGTLVSVMGRVINGAVVVVGESHVLSDCDVDGGI
jgi:hypothetical protein